MGLCALIASQDTRSVGFTRAGELTHDTVAATAYAALIAALLQNSWKCVTVPFRSVNTMAKSESKPFLIGVVAV